MIKLYNEDISKWREKLNRILQWDLERNGRSFFFQSTEAYSKPWQISKMELFAKIEKALPFSVWQVSEYASKTRFKESFQALWNSDS